MQEALGSLGAGGIAELEAAFDESPFGVYIDHPTEGCTYANPALLDLFGIDWPDFKGFGWARFVVSEDAERLQVAIRRFEHTREPIHVTYRVRHADDSERWVNARIRAVADARGERVGSIGLVFDVTEEREHRRRARNEQNLEAVGQLAARLAHDLNNLLTVIIGATQLMSSELESDEAREHYEMVEVAYEQATQLTTQLLTLARGHVSSSTSASPDGECRRLERLLRATLGERITLDLKLAAPQAHVGLDAGQLGQILVNLTTNARDAIPSTGRVEIETSCDEDHVTIRVTDDGAGMDADTLARAFEPFFTTRAPGRGSGLGLVTLKDIVELVDGTIRLDSSPGVGTTATIRLPRVSTLDYAPVREELVSSLAGRGLEVLLVEDNEALRQTLGYALGLAGITVRAAGSLEEASALLEKTGSPDLLVSDVMLPDGLGTDLVERVRANAPELPIVFMSGFASTAIEGLREGFPRAEFLSKPFRSHELIEAIGRLLHGPNGDA